MFDRPNGIIAKRAVRRHAVKLYFKVCKAKAMKNRLTITTDHRHWPLTRLAVESTAQQMKPFWIAKSCLFALDSND